MSASPLRSRLLAGDQLTGAIVRMPCEDLIDMMGVAGFDFVIVDCEHGPPDITALRQHIAFAQVHDVAVLVRCGEHEPGLALRALDQGAQGLVLPHLDDADQAKAAVGAAHYPPLGHRGFATYPRAGAFGTTSPREHQQRMAEQTLVIAMLESPTAVSRAEEILAVDGIDGYLVGTADLAAASGPNDPGVPASLEIVRAAGRAAGSVRADIVSDRDAAQAAHADGAQLVTYNLAAVLMTTLQSLRLP